MLWSQAEGSAGFYGQASQVDGCPGLYSDALPAENLEFSPILSGFRSRRDHPAPSFSEPVGAIRARLDASNPLLFCGRNPVAAAQQKHFAGASWETVRHSVRPLVLAER